MGGWGVGVVYGCVFWYPHLLGYWSGYRSLGSPLGYLPIGILIRTLEIEREIDQEILMKKGFMFLALPSGISTAQEIGRFIDPEFSDISINQDIHLEIMRCIGRLWNRSGAWSGDRYRGGFGVVGIVFWDLYRSGDWLVDMECEREISILINRRSYGISTCQEIDQGSDQELDQDIVLKQSLVFVVFPSGFNWGIVRIQLDTTI